MPRETVTNHRDKQSELAILISGTMKVSGRTQAELARSLGICSRTVSNLLKQPSDISIAQLVTISKVLEIPEDLIKSKICFT